MSEWELSESEEELAPQITIREGDPIPILREVKYTRLQWDCPLCGFKTYFFSHDRLGFIPPDVYECPRCHVNVKPFNTLGAATIGLVSILGGMFGIG